MLHFLTTPRNKVLRAEMTSLFNMCRLMDDIASVGMPSTVNIAALLRDERASGGTDGVYPTQMTDIDGIVIQNPMEVNREKHGLTCSYLDMMIHFKAGGAVQCEIYSKRDDMAVFKNYRRFPHIDSTLALSTRYNVFKSQLNRFASRCNHWKTFCYNAKRLLNEMIEHSYNRNTLLQQLDGFWLTFAQRQAAVFQITVRNPKQLWVRVMEACRKP
jgi:hypothetical protein